MSAHRSAALQLGLTVAHRAAVTLMALSALIMTLWTAMAIFGAAPWLAFAAQIGDQTYPLAGMSAQIAVTIFLLALCAYLPANARMMALETSHRAFHMSMRDVARAYALAHAADREGRFKLSSEFDEVRERLAFLRDHPDLGALEPQLLEVASQMSQTSKELAQTYSAQNVARARAFLKTRQIEADDMKTRLDRALTVTQELRFWLNDIEQEEDLIADKLEQLSAELSALLPDLSEELAALDADPAPRKKMRVVSASPAPRKEAQIVDLHAEISPDIGHEISPAKPTGKPH